MNTQLAYNLGREAKRNGSGLNTNPYDPYDEVSKYEAWFNGWVKGDN